MARVFGVHDVSELRDVGEMARGFGAGGEVGGVVLSESLDAAKHIVAASFTDIHGESQVGGFLLREWTRGNWRDARSLPSRKWHAFACAIGIQ